MLLILKLHIHELLKLAHKFVHHKYLLPNTFVNYFTINNAVHLHDTRIKENCVLSLSVKNRKKKSSV